jgi:integrase/recombinase XerD
MGAIRDRMIEELELRGMAPATKRSYLVCCRVFVAHFMKSPEQLGAEQVKAFLLHLVRERKAGPSTAHVYLSALSFLYRHVLRMPDVVSDLPYPRVPHKLPDVLSQEEVMRLLGAVRSLKLRTILTTAYAAGLRISEALRLRVEDVDSTRMVLHIRGAKHGKDRMVLLSPRLLAMLRACCVRTRFLDCTSAEVAV